MDHIDHPVQGKMMEEVVRLLMVEDTSREDQYLTFEMKTHEEAYKVTEFFISNANITISIVDDRG